MAGKNCTMVSAKMKELHIVMFPWLAYGHIIPFLHLANKLAQKGHHISFLLPNKAILHLDSSILHPSLITLHPITIPHVQSLPLGTETCSDIPTHLHNHLATAIDLARPQVESILSTLMPKPDLIFFDMATPWVPELGIKSIIYNVICTVILTGFGPKSGLDPPFVKPKWLLRPDQPWFSTNYAEGVTLVQRFHQGLRSCDAIAVRTCYEMEDESCELLATKYNKPVFLTGPILPDKAHTSLEAHWAEWLGKFEPRSVVFCCFGSQHIPTKGQLQELALGLEMTGLPFIMGVRTPIGCATMEDALPEGFEQRVGREHGVVTGGWVPQTEILAHPSVGSFVTHCGFGSMWEGLMSECRLVLVPQLPDQVWHAEILGRQLKVGVMVERREEDGWVSKQSLCEAIMNNNENQIINKNHASWREMLLSSGFMSAYIDHFTKDLQAFVSSPIHHQT